MIDDRDYDKYSSPLSNKVDLRPKINFETRYAIDTNPFVKVNHNDAPTISLTFERRHETQTTTVEWCRGMFGEEHSLDSRFSNLLEEVVELGLKLGVSNERMSSIVTTIYGRSVDTANDLESAYGEIGDVLITLECLASELGVDVQSAHDWKMAVNRGKTNEYFAEKQRKKLDAGLYAPINTP
jgi:NTP pyrophosphatase (non-canonical NTP hydrolase)